MMKMQKRIILSMICPMLFVGSAFSQNKMVVSCGKIKFEKRVSVKKKMIASKDEDDEGSFWFENMIKRAPDHTSEQFVMEFNPTESYYYFDKKISDNPMRGWGSDEVASKNIVYKDYERGISKSLKQFFEKDYLLQDSVKKFDWKLTREFRDIAGFECRKAVAIFNDSLYVIAFYTDDILCSSGPESFGGLPGMILGVVMTRLYTSWFATSVDTGWSEKDVINKPMQGNAIKEADLIGKIKDRYGKYKKWYQSLVWNLVI